MSLCVVLLRYFLLNNSLQLRISPFCFSEINFPFHLLDMLTFSNSALILYNTLLNFTLYDIICHIMHHIFCFITFITSILVPCLFR